MIMVLLASCNGEKKSTKQTQDTQKGEEEIKSPPEPKPAPAPGSAVVQALVQSVDRTADAILCTLQIEKVTAYGAGTPSIGKDSMLTLEVDPTVFKKNRSDLVAGNKLLLHINSKKNMSLTTNRSNKDKISWHLVSVK